MAKQRYIDTRFWHDEFVVEELNPLDRYLFLYLLTNDKTNIAGVYECPMKLIAIETGIDREELPRMFKRFKDKVQYVDGWVIIKNFQKYQSTTNEKIKKGIETEMSRIPDKIREKISYDRVSIPYEDQSHLNSNSNTNSNTNNGFDIFWKSYPRRVGKKDAMRVWAKIPHSEELDKKILTALERHKKQDQWKKDGGQYIPHPTTWLRGEKWNDEIGQKINSFL